MGCGGSKRSVLAEGPEDIPEDELLTPSKQSGRTVGTVDELVIRSADFVGCGQGLISKSYTIGSVLGDGAYGKVSIGTHKRTKAKRAIKTIWRDPKKAGQQEHDFINEVEILTKMDHPHIIKLYEYYIDHKNFHLVTDICQGGELFDYIIDNRSLSESIAAKVIKQLLSVLIYCHEHRIVHRDLKPENMLLERTPRAKDGSDLHIRVIDFGTSALFNPAQKMTIVQGTPYYMSPEVLGGNYDARCDVWSAGVIMYILLCGYPPFTSKKDEEIYAKIQRMKFSYPDKEWRGVSDSAKDMINKILVPQDQRPQAADIINHPWLQLAEETSIAQSDMEALSNLRSFCADRKLQQAVLVFITSQLLNSVDVKELNSTFAKFDTNGDGKLSRQELLDGYTQIVGQTAATEETAKIMRNVDTDGSGYIDYSEFIAASMNRKKLLSKQNLTLAFQSFDTDASGTITLDEIKKIMSGVCETTDEIWEQLLSECDADGNGTIDLKEFKDMMLKLF